MASKFGVLPESGGLLDQHPRVIHYFGIINGALADLEKKLAKRQEVRNRNKPQ